MDNTKTALVTGANKGIGFAVALGLGAAGFTVAVGARDHARRAEAVERLRAADVDAFGISLDVTSAERGRGSGEHRADGWTARRARQQRGYLRSGRR